ncbi:hypothetical protein [Pseudomonas mangrovi]|jgi:hypothetical protein|uniref:Uncharacterized protein n=1 Tax=Pseudomonas mangrovi TaxID=2161748 RepID=A0A2T5P500_9PSED|nr:hypothetical protein [Pseudomonas mangrovi]PTU72757.1 hypothetical protein DBO85_18570 [Pseudomonas mangrovi]
MSNTHDKPIGPVPSHIIAGARLQLTAYEGRVAEFNVASWLQLPGLANLPVSMIVTYRDAGALREVSVDHGKVNSHGKILLSGIARMPVKQKLEEVLICLRSAVPAKALIVEELFVQAVEPANAQDDSQAMA